MTQNLDFLKKNYTTLINEVSLINSSIYVLRNTTWYISNIHFLVKDGGGGGYLVRIKITLYKHLKCYDIFYNKLSYLLNSFCTII